MRDSNKGQNKRAEVSSTLLCEFVTHASAQMINSAKGQL